MFENMTPENKKLMRRRYYRLGACQFAAGTVALFAPLVTAFSREAFIGIIFLITAIPSGFNAFLGFCDGDKPWQQTLVALISLTAGLVFLFHPLAGIITLSLFMATYFFVGAAMKTMEFWRLRGVRGAPWVLLAGIIEMALALILWGNFGGGATMLGVMFGFQLITAGAAFVMLGKKCGEP